MIELRIDELAEPKLHSETGLSMRSPSAHWQTRGLMDQIIMREQKLLR